MRFEPWHTPFESADTHAPFSVYRPAAQRMQSLDVAPVHVPHVDEQVEQDAPLLKLPSGHTVPVDVVDLGGMHWEGLLGFWVNPVLHAIQAPVKSAHRVQPSWQTEG